VTLVETHTALERHVGDARRAVVGTAYQAQQTVQGLVERWIGVERAVERECWVEIAVRVGVARGTRVR
jgi:organizing structure protein 2